MHINLEKKSEAIMRNVSKWAGLTLTCFACLFYPVYESNALTDDTGIIAGLNRDVNTY